MWQDFVKKRLLYEQHIHTHYTAYIGVSFLKELTEKAVGTYAKLAASWMACQHMSLPHQKLKIMYFYFSSGGKKYSHIFAYPIIQSSKVCNTIYGTCNDDPSLVFLAEAQRFITILLDPPKRVVPSNGWVDSYVYWSTVFYAP